MSMSVNVGRVGYTSGYRVNLAEAVFTEKIHLFGTHDDVITDL